MGIFLRNPQGRADEMRLEILLKEAVKPGVLGRGRRRARGQHAQGSHEGNCVQESFLGGCSFARWVRAFGKRRRSRQAHQERTPGTTMTAAMSSAKAASTVARGHSATTRQTCSRAKRAKRVLVVTRYAFIESQTTAAFAAPVRGATKMSSALNRKVKALREAHRPARSKPPGLDRGPLGNRVTGQQAELEYR